MFRYQNQVEIELLLPLFYRQTFQNLNISMTTANNTQLILNNKIISGE